MNTAATIFAATAAVSALSTPVMAQNAEFQLPEQCAAASTTGEMDHSSMGHGDMHGNRPSGMMDMTETGGADFEAMPEHAQENMRRMMITMPDMHKGMMMQDADVAFACGMIAHHRGASTWRRSCWNMATTSR